VPSFLESLLVGGAEIAAGVMLAPVPAAGGMYAGMELFKGAGVVSSALIKAGRMTDLGALVQDLPQPSP